MFEHFFTQIARKGYVALADQSVISVTNFLTGVLLARFVEPDEYGAYVLASSALLLASGLQTQLISGPMAVIGAPKEGDDFKRYVTALGLGQAVMSALLAALAFAVVAIMFFTQASAGLKNAFLGMAVSLFFVQLQEFCRRALFSRLMTVHVLLNDAIFCAFRLGGLFLLWQLDAGASGQAGKWLSARNVFFSISISALVGGVVGLFQVRRFVGTDLQEAREFYAESWSFARWGLAGYAGSLLIVQASMWLVGGMAGIAAAGMIEAARLLVAPLHILEMGGPNIVTPGAARAYGQGGARALSLFIRRLSPFWVSAFVLYGIVIAAVPGFWLRLFFGDRYASAGLVVTLWVGVYIVSGLRLLPGFVLSALRRPDIITYIIIPEGIIAVALTGALVRYCGVEWAVAGRLLSAIVGACASALWGHILLQRTVYLERN
jgi:O-antigen/teichoic acid export membrane protein